MVIPVITHSGVMITLKKSLLVVIRVLDFGGNQNPINNTGDLYVYGQRDGNSTTFDASDLLARIATLEADHATMMNNNSGGSY